MEPVRIMLRGKPMYKLDARAKGAGRIFGGSKDECWEKFRAAMAGVDQVEFTDQDKLAKKEIDGKGTLLDAVRYFLARAPLANDKSLALAGAGWIAESKRQNLSKKFIGHCEFVLRHFTNYVGADTAVSNITSQQIKNFLGSKKWSIETQNTIRGRLVSLFSYCVADGCCQQHPIKEKRVPGIKDKRKRVPRIFTVDECERLLTTAAEHYPQMLPYLVLGLFCGIRPDAQGEMGRLTAENIHLDEGVIVIPQGFSKTEDQREVKIAQNAVAWLRLAPSLNICTARYTRRNLCKKAGLTWSADVMRHCFASYHYKHFKNGTLTAQQMGHEQSLRM